MPRENSDHDLNLTSLMHLGIYGGTHTGSIQRIVFVGDISYGSTSGMRYEALERLASDTHSISRIIPELRPDQMLMDGLLWKIKHPRDYGLNKAILYFASRDPVQVLWCDRPLHIKPETLETAKALIPGIKLVSYRPDDMMRSHNQSSCYLHSIPIYDLHVTTKSYNVDELKALGARNAVFVNNAFCPRVHFPVEVTREEKKRFGGPVGFVGTYEPERAVMLMALARAGIPVRVWGANWSRGLRSYSPNLQIEYATLSEDSYRLAVNGFDINLGLLRNSNRDTQTARSVEIAACGGFLLAERTAEHQALFREDSEAVYFSSTEELIGKVRQYLSDELGRRTIARNGFRRAVSAPYTYEAQVGYVLENLYR
jgi:spore maturation protein CgeB